MTDSTLNWLDALPLCELAMNRVVSRSDGLSASQRLFGFNIALPLLPSTEASRVSPREGCDRSAETLITLLDAFYIAKEKSASQHDKGRVPSRITVGSLVTVRRKLVKSSDSTFTGNTAYKERNPFVGPYLVTADMDHGNWLLQGFENTNTDPMFHEDNLKLHTKFIAPTPAQAGLRHDDLFWPDGRQRVQEVLARRSRFDQPQYLVKFAGNSPADSGAWLSLSSLHLLDHQKIADFNLLTASDS